MEFDQKKNQLMVSETFPMVFSPGQRSKAVSYRSITFDCTGASCQVKPATCAFKAEFVPDFKKTVTGAKGLSNLKFRKYVNGSESVVSELLVEALRGNAQATRLLRKAREIGADGHLGEQISEFNAVLGEARSAGCNVKE